MKLHLPQKLRNSLLTSIDNIAVLTTTLAAGVLFSAQTQAANAISTAVNPLGNYELIAGGEYDMADYVWPETSENVKNDDAGRIDLGSGTYKLTLGADSEGQALSITMNGFMNATSATLMKSGVGALVLSDISSQLGTLQVEGGTFEVQDGGETGFAKLISVGPGASLVLNAVDALGYTSDGAATSVTLGGSADGGKATLSLGGRQTLNTELILNGYAEISATRYVSNDPGVIQSFGGSITATGVNNTISSGISLQYDFTIDVTDSTEELAEGEVNGLVISGALAQRSGSYTPVLTKTGTGSLTLKGGLTLPSNAAAGTTFKIEAGSVALRGTTAYQFKSTEVAAGAKLTVEGTFNSNKFSILRGSVAVKGELLTVGNALGYWNLSSDLTGIALEGGTWTLEGEKVILCQTYTSMDGGTLVLDTTNGVHFDPGDGSAFTSTSAATAQSVIKAADDNANSGNVLGIYKGNLIFDVANSTRLDATDTSTADMLVQVGIIKDSGKIYVGDASSAETGSFVKRGDGILEVAGGFLPNNGTTYVDVAVNEGTLRISGDSTIGALSFAEGALLEVAGASLTVGSLSNSGSLTLAGGATLRNYAVDGTHAWSTLALSGENELELTYQGTQFFEKVSSVNADTSLPAADKLTINIASKIGGGQYNTQERYTTIGTIENFHGSIVQDLLFTNNSYTNATIASHTLTINAANQSAGYAAYIGGASQSSADFVKTGEGSISFENHTALENFSIDAGSLLAGTLTLTAGKTLTLVGGTFGVANGLSTSNATTLGKVTLGGADGAGALAFTGGVNFVGTATNTVALTLGGALDVSLASFLDAGSVVFKDASGNELAAADGNGFEGGAFWLVKNSGSGATVSLASGTTLTVEGSVVDGLTVDDAGAYFSYGDSTIYHVKTGTVAYGDIVPEGAATVASSVSLNGGTLSLAEGDAVNVADGISLTAASAISAQKDTVINAAITADETCTGGLTISSSGTGADELLALRGDIDLGSQTLTIDGGWVSFGQYSSGHSANSLAAQKLVVNSGATFMIHHEGEQSADYVSLAEGVELAGGNIYVRAIDSDTGGSLALGGLAVTAASSISSQWGGTLKFDSLTGSGDLSITGNEMNASSVLSVVLGDVSDYSGELSINKSSSSPSVTISSGTLAGALSLNGGELTLASGAALGSTLKVTADSTLTLGSSAVSLAASAVTVSSGTLTLKGTGTYTMGGNHGSSTLSGLSLTNTEWKGLVHLSGSGAYSDKDETTGLHGLNLADYGNAGSTIKLQGLKGYLSGKADSTTKVNSHVIFENTSNDRYCALEIVNGYSNSTVEFTGTVSGGGNVVRTWSPTTGGALSYTFSGDVSGWKNAHFRTTNSVGETNVTFSGSATTINVALQGDGAADFNVTVANDKDVAFNSAISSSKGINLTFSGTGNKTVSNTNAFTGTTTIEAGSVTTKSGVNLGDVVTVKSGTDTAATISKKQSTTGVAYSGVTISKDGIAAASGSDTSSLSHAAVTVDKAFALDGVTASDCAFTLNDALTVGEGSTFTGNTTVDIKENGSLIGDGSLVLSGEGHSLKLGNVTTTTARFDGLTYLQIDSTQLQGLSATSNASFVLDLGMTKEQLSGLIGDSKLNGLFFSFSMVFTAPAAEGTQAAAYGLMTADENAPVAPTLSFTLSEASVSTLRDLGFKVDSTISTTVNENGELGFQVNAIPEPTTATLSLLALAALAARRRRR